MDPIPLVTGHYLPREYVEDGRRFIRELIGAGVDVPAAFWLYELEPEAWKLTVGTSLYTTDGPIGAYRKVLTVFKSTSPSPSFPATRIRLAAPDDRLIRALSLRFFFNSEHQDTIMESASLDGNYIEAVYLYSLPECRREQKPTPSVR